MLPQIIMIILLAVGFICNQALAGQRAEKFNVFATALSIVISAVILTWGGFFTAIGAAQILYIAYFACGFIMVGLLHGKQPTSKRSALSGLIVYGTVVALQYWGGFYDAMI